MEYVMIGRTAYFHFSANDTAGTGADGATPTFDVRLCGAAAGAIPVLSGTPTLLTHANYPDGCHEVAVVASLGNGFAKGSTYAVFVNVIVDGQTPSGMVGKFMVVGEPTAIPTFSDDLGAHLSYWVHVAIAEVNQTATQTTVRNIADAANIATYPTSDNGTTFSSGAGV